MYAEYAGDARKITREYFDRIVVEERLIGTAVPDTKTTIFGKTYASPIMTAALSHLGGTGLTDYAMAAK